MPNDLPQAFIQMRVGTTARLQHSSIAPDYIFKVFIGLLWSPEPLCTMAIRALAEIGAESAPFLIKACASHTLPPSVYDEVVGTLVEMDIDAKVVVPEFLRLLEEGHPYQASLLSGLARIAPNYTPVVNYLSSFFASEDDARQDAVIAALNKIASYKVIDILRGVQSRRPDKEEKSLIERLESGSAEEKLAAIKEIEKRLPLGARFFAEPLLSIIEEDVPPTSSSAGSYDASELRDKAARALALVLPCLPDALTTWLPLLMDANFCQAISCGDSAQPLFDWFCNLLCSSNSAPGVCYICARILKNFGAQGVPFLIKGMSSSSGHRQFILARELGQMGRDAVAAVPELLRITNHSRSFPWLGDRSAILDALARSHQTMCVCLRFFRK